MTSLIFFLRSRLPIFKFCPVSWVISLFRFVWFWVMTSWFPSSLLIPCIIIKSSQPRSSYYPKSKDWMTLTGRFFCPENILKLRLTFLLKLCWALLTAYCIERLIQQAIGVALKVIEACEVRMTPSPLKKGCEMFNIFPGPSEYTWHRAKGQRTARSDGCYRRQCNR